LGDFGGDEAVAEFNRISRSVARIYRPSSSNNRESHSQFPESWMPRDEPLPLHGGLPSYFVAQGDPQTLKKK